MTTSSRSNKITRLQGGASLRVLDLFAGCGGLSLGFDAAGFEIAGAIELDSWAALSHARNFHPDVSPDLFQRHAAARDITAIEPEEVLSELATGNLRPEIDVIIGGPPCQAFARVGRAKLREVAEHPEAFRQDPRGNLYLRYLHYVRQLKPLALVMENVPDVLNYGGHNIPEEMCEVLAGLGYACRYTLLNASYYGVPQMRERLFLIAITQELVDDAEVLFPPPTHWVQLPRGYESSRQVAMKAIKPDLFNQHRFFVTPPVPDPDLPPSITVEEAIGDLPPITGHLRGELKRGARRFNEPILYGTAPVSDYGMLMRSWPGFEAGPVLLDHVIRRLPRDYAIFRRMNPGDQYPEAHRHAMDMLCERLAALRRDGHDIPADSQEYRDLVASIVPGYDPNKFPNKWRKMEADQPARTLMAHLGKDSYSHIHYDSDQARTISVREAARLQSFPDGFAFAGTMNPAFRQIGNAVPPLLARAVSTHLMSLLTAALERRNTYAEIGS